MSAGGNALERERLRAEAARPYGVWIDILRAIVARCGLATNCRQISACCFPSSARRPSRRPEPAVRCRGRSAPANRRGTAVAIILDDIQWIDEASSSLLHYVARHIDAASGLLIVCAARDGEIEDNAAASRVLRSLAREKRLREDRTRSTRPRRNRWNSCAQSILRSTARASLPRATAIRCSRWSLPALISGGDAEPGPTIEAVIAGQLAPLTEQAREVLLWAAALGARLHARRSRARRPSRRPLNCSRHSANWSGADWCGRSASDAYDFTHDLVRQTAYRTVVAAAAKAAASAYRARLRRGQQARYRSARRTSPITRRSPTITRRRHEPA